MCGRYGLDMDRESDEWREIVEAVNRRVVVDPITTSGEVFPTNTVPVVAADRRMRPSAFAMQWGYTLPDGRRLINTRSETARQRPLFRDGMLRRRCAVPASRYYEWERAGNGRRKYAIRPDGGGLFYMAGIYRLEGKKPVFSILTREPAEGIAFIHDRMPVILPRDLVADWVDPRRAADELLERAVLSVCWEREAEAEQLTMPL